MDNEQIVAEASEWFVTLRDDGVVDQATQASFLAWLCRSPEHVDAYLGIVAVWSDVPGLPVQPETDVDALIERARAQQNVVPLSATMADHQSRRPMLDDSMPDGPVRDGSILDDECSNALAVPVRAATGNDDAAASPRPSAVRATLASQASRASRVWRALAACAVLAVAGLAAAMWVQRAPSFETAIGEQRSLRLADGSIVDLNSRSLIRVHFSDTQRLVELVQGQALFRVAKDATRAFVVSSDTARVRAVGTQFDVSRRKDGTIVTVVEGRVAVTDSEREAPQSLLSAGQQLTVRREVPIARPLRADVAAVTSWTHGVLTFRSERLSVVVDEFNRYNPRRIVLDDSVEDFPVTATFASTDSAALVRFLEAQTDLRVETSDAEIRVRAISGHAAH